MTMHLLPVYFSSNRSTNKRKKSTNKKLAEANSAHKAWIQDITKGKKSSTSVDKSWATSYDKSLKSNKSNYVSSGISGSSDSCAAKGIMTRLHKESKATREEILRKASRCMPLYNKGGLQYATDGEDLTQVGSKSRRG